MQAVGVYAYVYAYAYACRSLARARLSRPWRPGLPVGAVEFSRSCGMNTDRDSVGSRLPERLEKCELVRGSPLRCTGRLIINTRDKLSSHATDISSFQGFSRLFNGFSRVFNDFSRVSKVF